jgi:hypothetical protein
MNELEFSYHKKVGFACLKIFEQKPQSCLEKEGIFLLCPGSVVPLQNNKLMQMKTKICDAAILAFTSGIIFLRHVLVQYDHPPSPLFDCPSPSTFQSFMH